MDLIKRLRGGQTVPTMQERHAAADEILRLRAEVAALTREMANNARMRDLLDRRPASGPDLPAAYAKWAKLVQISNMAFAYSSDGLPQAMKEIV